MNNKIAFLPFTIVFSLSIISNCTAQNFKLTPQNYKVEAIKEIDSSIFKMLKPYKDNLSGKMDKVIGFCLNGMFKKQPECGLGNMMVDAMKVEAEKKYGQTIDIAIMNFGGIRAALPKGDITMRNMYEIMPFDNMLVLQMVKGSQVQQLLDKAAEKGGWPVSGVTMQIAEKKAVNITINNQPLDTLKTYVLAVSDYLANGGDDCKMLKEIPKVDKGYTIRDALIAYVISITDLGKPIDSKTEKRVTYGNK